MKHVNPKLRRKHAILHECGHCLIFWYYGFIIIKISIAQDLNPGANFAGYLKSDCEQGGTSFLHRNALNAARVYGMMSGRLAAELYLPEVPSENGHSYDFSTIEELVTPDPDTLAMVQWRQTNPDATVEQFFHAFKNPVVKILKSTKARRAVHALAKVLDRAESLSGQEAVSILQKAWGDPPPPLALPVERHQGLLDRNPKIYGDLIRELQAHTALMLHDVKCLRDTGTKQQREHMDKIWGQIKFFEKVVLT